MYLPFSFLLTYLPIYIFLSSFLTALLDRSVTGNGRREMTTFGHGSELNPGPDTASVQRPSLEFSIWTSTLALKRAENVSDCCIRCHYWWWAMRTIIQICCVCCDCFAAAIIKIIRSRARLQHLSPFLYLFLTVTGPTCVCVLLYTLTVSLLPIGKWNTVIRF